METEANQGTRYISGAKRAQGLGPCSSGLAGHPGIVYGKDPTDLQPNRPS